MLENLTKIKKCDYCRSDASDVCFKCNDFFCNNCYKIIHELRKDSEHKKIEINPYLSIDLFCPMHPKNPLELFCLDDKGNFYYNNFIYINYF